MDHLSGCCNFLSAYLEDKFSHYVFPLWKLQLTTTFASPDRILPSTTSPTITEFFSSTTINRHDPWQMYPSGIVLTLVCLVFLYICHRFVLRFIANPLSMRLLPKQAAVGPNVSPDASKGTPSKPMKKLPYGPQVSAASCTSQDPILVKKFNVALWKAINYGLLYSYGFYFIFVLEKGNPWIWEYEKYIIPTDNISWAMALYYHLNIAHYLYGFYCLMSEPRLKDFKQMIVHHVTTLFLEIGSYYWINTCHIGAAVMLLHDVSDPFMETAKVFMYCKHQFFANIFFVIFATTFIISRCVIYPICAVAPLFYSKNTELAPGFLPFRHGLCVIQVLDLFWSYLILKMIARHIVHGDVKGDIRED